MTHPAVRPRSTPDHVADEIMGRPAELGVTLALLVVQGGDTVIERYGVRPANLFHPEPEAVTADTPLVSWSVAKSVTHAAVGALVADGRLVPTEPAPVPEWAGTAKAAITLLDLLEMRSGLAFVEDYVDGETSDCLAMLFGVGAADHAAYAADRPLAHPPGVVWNYSSGTTNIITRILGDVVSRGASDPAVREAAMRAFLDERVFGPTGMTAADPRFDAAGNFVGSSYVHAPARDFARFGELYLRDGCVGDRRVLPPGWVDHARTTIATDPESGFGYGRHWWTWPDQPGSVAAHGYEGQYVVVLPEHDAVAVHLGKTDAAVRPPLIAQLRRLIASLPGTIEG